LLFTNHIWPLLQPPKQQKDKGKRIRDKGWERVRDRRTAVVVIVVIERPLKTTARREGGGKTMLLICQLETLN
jgi:hypothetical protein